EGEQLLVGDDAGRLVHGVEQRTGVALAEDEAIVVRSARVGPVEAEVLDEEDGHEVGGGHAGRGVSAAGGRGAANAIDAELGGQLLPSAELLCHLCLTVSITRKTCGRG